MALCKKMNIEFNSGLKTLIDNVYIRINSFAGDKNGISIYVGKYISLENYLNNKESLEPIKIYSFVPNISENSLNFIKQGYEYLKTLTEYEDAMDC